MTTPILQEPQKELTVTFTSQIPTELEREPTAIVLTTKTFQPALPEIIRFHPQQIHQQSLCPTDDFVSIQDLGIQSNLGLLLADGNVSDSEAELPYPIFLYKPTTELPGTQFTLNQANKMHSVPISSPDGRFVYYLQYDKGQPARTLVVQSTDGQTRKIVLERDYPFGYPSWIDNRYILWQDVPNPEDYWDFGERTHARDYIPTHLIDVKTLQVQELHPIQFPEKDDEYYVQGFIHNKAGNEVFLQHNRPERISFEIYSYTTQTSQPVFTWLPEKFLLNLGDITSFINSNGRINFIAMNGNMFWIVSKVSVEQVLSGTDALAGHVYELNFPEESTPSFIPYYFNTQNAFLYTHENRLNEYSLEPVPENLYRLDVDSQTIYDYCFDVQKWMGVSDMSVSPDEAFVAITLFEDPMTGKGKKDTILINLSTGDRAILPGYQVLGWVSVNN